jgi:hypothetical protein
MTAGYSGTPLPRKLGVRPDSRVLVVNAPDDFDPGAPYDTAPDGEPYDVVLLFCADIAALRAGFGSAVAAHGVAGMVWVCWPKRSSGVPTDLSDGIVRQYGLDHGQVDVKVTAVDATWSGLKFVTRLRDR